MGWVEDVFEVEPWEPRLWRHEASGLSLQLEGQCWTIYAHAGRAEVTAEVLEAAAHIVRSVPSDT